MYFTFVAIYVGMNLSIAKVASLKTRFMTKGNGFHFLYSVCFLMLLFTQLTDYFAAINLAKDPLPN